MLYNVRNVTFWGFDGSTLSHGSGFLVLFKLKTVNENATSLLSISYIEVRLKYKNSTQKSSKAPYIIK